jgi:hypothetical protein
MRQSPTTTIYCHMGIEFFLISSIDITKRQPRNILFCICTSSTLRTRFPSQHF